MYYDLCIEIFNRRLSTEPFKVLGVLQRYSVCQFSEKHYCNRRISTNISDMLVYATASYSHFQSLQFTKYIRRQPAIIV